ncbi:MAG: 23S rRNA pseudouridine1911/1915/1917 synthase [Lysobacterales bacterium]|jgi:23S rRNA pseudouridine1911/1915/1917 synthase
MRIDQAIAELFPDFSRSRLQSWIRNGSLVLDGSPVRPKHRVAGGEMVRLEAELEPESQVTPQDIPLNIIAEDEHIIVINKPAGLVVHPAAGHADGTLQNGLLYFDPSLATIPRSGIVHRLDKDTSGVMVVARSLKAHNALVSQLQDRSMSRIYRAVAHGVMQRSGSVDAPIGRNPHDRQKMAVVPSGRPAVSHFKLLKAFEHFSHIRVSLQSGRTHQIRVHMRHIGHPLIGDPQYGQKLPKTIGLEAGVAKTVSEFPRQALHARTLRLIHPQSGKECEFTAPVPDDFADLLLGLAEGDFERKDDQ